MQIAIGTRLGPYEILAPLGAGGMGEVYRARDQRLARDVAIKVLPESLALDGERRARFESEARAVAALSHPNILALHDIGSEGETMYAVLEFLDGDTLRQRLEESPLPVQRALSFALQIAHGLAAAHDKGVVHRDLKPENVMITRDGRLKILDFGLAKRTLPGEPQSNSMSPTVGVATRLGVAIGTPGYMAPEQVRGLAADSRSDLFALGAVLYEMIAGRRAFEGETPADAMSAILREEPPDFARLGLEVAPAIDRIVRRCLEKHPDARFRSAHDLAFALESVSGAERVAATGAAPARVEGARTEPVFRRLTYRNGYVRGARFTPDGQAVVYGAAWEGRPLEVFTSRPGSPDSRSLSLPAADVLSVSAAGEMALAVGLRHHLYHLASATLARASLMGGGVRVLLGDVSAADWAADGRSMAIMRMVEGRCRLEYPAGNVLQETDDWMSLPRVSRDGALVAYADQPVRGDTGGSVCVVDGSKQRRVLAARMASLSGIAWSPRGDEVWFSGVNEELRNGIWAVDLSGRRRALHHAPSRVWLHDVAPSGRALVSVGLHRAGMNAGTVGGAADVNLSWFDGSVVTDFTPDGSQVLFIEAHEAENPRYAIYLRPVDGAPAVRIGEGTGLRISPDGAWVLGISNPPEHDFRLHPTGMGESRSLRSPEIERYLWAGWHPDGERIYVVGSGPHGQRRLFTGTRRGGPYQMIWNEEIDVDWTQGVPISPNGGRVVLRRPNGDLVLFSVPENDAGLLPGLDPQDRPIRFDATGRSLFVARREGNAPSVDRVDLETGERRHWCDIAPPDPAGISYIANPVMTPNGDRYAYSYLRTLADLYDVDGLGE